MKSCYVLTNKLLKSIDKNCFHLKNNDNKMVNVRRIMETEAAVERLHEIPKCLKVQLT